MVSHVAGGKALFHFKYSRLAGVIIGMAFSSFVFAEEESETGWTIIDARAFPATIRQPTWIGIVRSPAGGRKMLHIPTRQTVVRMEPGKYQIIHLDFGKSEVSEFDTVYINREKFGHFEVVPDVITVVGVVDINLSQKTLLGTYLDIGIHGTTEVLAWACARDPDLMARLPLRVAQKDGTYASRKVTCNAE